VCRETGPKNVQKCIPVLVREESVTTCKGTWIPHTVSGSFLVWVKKKNETVLITMKNVKREVTPFFLGRY
jgi:hypothetical protein